MNDSEQTRRSEGLVSLEQFRAAGKRAMAGGPVLPEAIFVQGDVEFAYREMVAQFGTYALSWLLAGIAIGRDLYGTLSEDERRLIEDFRASTR